MAKITIDPDNAYYRYVHRKYTGKNPETTAPVTIDTDSAFYRYIYRKLSGGKNPEDV